MKGEHSHVGAASAPRLRSVAAAGAPAGSRLEGDRIAADPIGVP